MADNHQNAQKSRENLHVNFDHLSIVSEENTPNCDDTLSSTTGHSHGNVTPIPEFQSNVPSLAHFENLRYEEIGPNLGRFGFGCVENIKNKSQFFASVYADVVKNEHSKSES